MENYYASPLNQPTYWFILQNDNSNSRSPLINACMPQFQYSFLNANIFKP
jgi:hypothetical protein